MEVWYSCFWVCRRCCYTGKFIVLPGVLFFPLSKRCMLWYSLWPLHNILYLYIIPLRVWVFPLALMVPSVIIKLMQSLWKFHLKFLLLKWSGVTNSYFVGEGMCHSYELLCITILKIKHQINDWLSMELL